MSRTPRPIEADKVTINVLTLIAQHADKPCPTRNEIMRQTGLQQREVWNFMRTLQDRGLIEIEERAVKPGNIRRIRITGGPWTNWTQRRVPTRRDQLMANAAGVG